MNFFPLILIFFNVAFSSEDCGIFRYTTPTIASGVVAIRGQFPYLFPLVLKSTNEKFCGGNIISRIVALTAAHCISAKGSLKKLKAEEIEALPGKYNFDNINEIGVITMQIEEIIVHEDWDTINNSYDADLAVLLFKNSLEYTNFISPICLPTASKLINGGSIAGWGQAVAERKTESILLTAEMNAAIENGLCISETMNIASKRSFCSKGKNNRGTCRGDSGGGFIAKSDGKWQLHGIVSSYLDLSNGEFCDTTTYNIFTNVSMFTDWINNFQCLSDEILVYAGKNHISGPRMIFVSKNVKINCIIRYNHIESEDGSVKQVNNDFASYNIDVNIFSTANAASVVQINDGKSKGNIQINYGLVGTQINLSGTSANIQINIIDNCENLSGTTSSIGNTRYVFCRNNAPSSFTRKSSLIEFKIELKNCEDLKKNKKKVEGKKVSFEICIPT